MMKSKKCMMAIKWEIKKSIINQGDGVTRVTTTPKVTSKGQSYFINKMLSERGLDIK